MPLQRGEVLGYDFNRMVVDFTMSRVGFPRNTRAREKRRELNAVCKHRKVLSNFKWGSDPSPMMWSISVAIPLPAKGSHCLHRTAGMAR